MINKNIKYIASPIVIFLIFIIAISVGDDAIQDFNRRVIGKSYQFLPYFISIGAWLSAAFLLNRLLNLTIWNFLILKVTGNPAPRLIIQLSNITIYLLAVAGIIGVVFEKSLTGFLATSGAIGLVLGFALRSIILDLFSGLSINMERPFIVGDFIQVYIRGIPMKFGIVQEVNWRTTKLKTLDNTTEIIPNSVLGTSTLTNLTGTGPVSRFQMILGFDFSIEPERVLRLINAGLRDATLARKGPLANPRPKVKTSSYEQGNIQYKIKYMVDTSKCSPGAARASILENVFRHVRAAGLKPAYDKSDVIETPMEPLSLSKEERIRNTLEASVLSTELDKNELNQLVRISTLKTVPAGNTVVSPNDPTAGIYLVQEGVVDFSNAPEADEDCIRIDSINTGGCVGAIGQTAPSFKASAATEVILLEIPEAGINKHKSAINVLNKTLKQQNEDLETKFIVRKEEHLKQREMDIRQTFIENLAGQVRHFFKEQLKSNLASVIGNLVGESPEQKVVKATLAATALITAADGIISVEERAYVEKTLGSLDLFKEISAEDGLAMFDEYVGRLQNEPSTANDKLMAIIGNARVGTEVAEIIVDICKAISSSDGSVDESEERIIQKIADVLGVKYSQGLESRA